MLGGGWEAGIALLLPVAGEGGEMDEGWSGSPLPLSLSLSSHSASLHVSLSMVYWCITAHCSLLSVISLSAEADSISHSPTNTNANP